MINSIKKTILLCGLLCGIAGFAYAYSPAPIPDIHYTDLHKAAEDCDSEKVRADLVSLSAEEKKAKINQMDRGGYTPLAYAAQNGCVDTVKLLLEAGANVDAAEAYLGWTPLLRAAQGRHADVVRALLERGAAVNVRVAMGKTPWTEAIRGSTFNHGPEGDLGKTLELLLESGADWQLGDEREALEIQALKRDSERMRYEIEMLEADREKMAHEIQHLRETLDRVRSQVGNDQPRPN